MLRFVYIQGNDLITNFIIRRYFYKRFIIKKKDANAKTFSLKVTFV